MKHNGIELKEITESQIFDPPKEMLVWDSGHKKPKTKLVWGISPCAVHNLYRVHCDNGARYMCCAEIPEEPKKRATNIQLMEWIAKGNGVWKSGRSVNTYLSYFEDSLEKEVEDYILIRPFGTTEWLEPTLENMGLLD